LESNFQKISILTKDIPIVTPPGPYEEYPPSGVTYLINEDDKNEYLADNPYIIEYLLFNNKKNLIPFVTNQLYLDKKAIRLHKNKNNEFNIFFYKRIEHLLHFPIEEVELPVFKTFLDHTAYRRKKSDFFFWDFKEFSDTFTYLTHKMSDVQLLSLHQRLCGYHRNLFPGEAIKSVFIKK
jgi:hypothetical protein